MAERVIIPEMDLSGIIAKSRDVAQALNEFADDLERIDKKYAKWQLRENEESLCDSCEYGDCALEQRVHKLEEKIEKLAGVGDIVVLSKPHMCGDVYETHKFVVEAVAKK